MPRRETWLQAPPANYVRFRISGDPLIAIGASIKTAGDQLHGCAIELIADQQCGTDNMLPYEELLGDAMAGNQTWFAREDYVEEAWRIVDPILNNNVVTPYEPGSWGPAEADKLVAHYGGWHGPWCVPSARRAVHARRRGARARGRRCARRGDPRRRARRARR